MENPDGQEGHCGDTYDRDHVSMIILASVTFLLPLHDCGCDVKLLSEVKERAAICEAQKMDSKRGLQWWSRGMDDILC